jgi:hypothetical protein
LRNETAVSVTDLKVGPIPGPWFYSLFFSSIQFKTIHYTIQFQLQFYYFQTWYALSPSLLGALAKIGLAMYGCARSSERSLILPIYYQIQNVLALLSTCCEFIKISG